MTTNVGGISVMMFLLLIRAVSLAVVNEQHVLRPYESNPSAFQQQNIWPADK
jgi:hypothetical protein